MILYGLDWLALALAIAWGRPPVWLAIVVTANLAAGYWGGQIELALFDLTAASLCFGRGRKGDLLAAVYICAVFVNLTLWLLRFPDGTTYAILGAIAWVQFGVLGGMGSGLGNSYRRLRAGMASLSQRAVASAVARNHEPDRGGLK